MRYRKISLLTILVLSAAILSAQDTLFKNTIKVNFGMGNIARQDLVFSPFIHKDVTLLNAGLEYKREAFLFQSIKLRYSGFTPAQASNYEYMEDGELKISAPHSLTFIDLDYLIGKTKTSGRNGFTAGGMFMADIQAMNYIYGRFSNFGYYAVLGVGVFGKYICSFGEKGSLSATMQLPAVSWYARSPYLVNDDEFIENIYSHSGIKSFMAFLGDGGVTTWNRLQYFDLGIEYSYDLPRGWGIGSSYLLEFVHAGRPRSLISFRNSIYLSAYLKF